MSRWEKEEWEESRKDFMDNLGHRAQAWEGVASSHLLQHHAGSPAPRGGLFGVNEEATPLAIMPPSSSSWFGSGGDVTSSSLLQTPQKPRNGLAVEEACERAEAQQLPLLRDHARACRTLHMIDQTELRDGRASAQSVPMPCRDLLASLPNSASAAFAQFDIRGENELKGYGFLLKLIAAMTGEGQLTAGRSKPGYFSPVVADSMHQSSQHPSSSTTSRELQERRELLSTGARVHLQNDYRDDVIRPESAAYMRNVPGHEQRSGQIGRLEASLDHSQDDKTLAHEVQRYVRSILPSSHSGHRSIELDEDGVFFWPQVYICNEVLTDERCHL